MNPNNNERLWWRRLARRTRADAPRTNRLSHFEPLEQRTVLSANVFMPGDGDFFRTPHDAHHDDFGGLGHYMAAYESAPQRVFFGGNHFGPSSHDDFSYHGPIVAPLNSNDGLLVIGGPLRDLLVDRPLRPNFDPAESDGESTSAPAASPTTLIAPDLETGASYKVEIVIVHDDEPAKPDSAAVVITPISTSRVTILTPTYVNAVDSGIFATLAAAAMQRRVEPTPYAAPSRYGS